jgi:hypothetical protein
MGERASRKARTSQASPLVLQWAETLTNQNAWPEGKTVAGFEKWLRSNFYQAQKEAKDLSKLLGIPHDAGHGSQGANTLSNLAPQLRFGPDGNRDLVDRTTGEQISRALDHVRLRKDLMDVDADFYLSQAFESYLNKGTIDPKSQLNLADFSAKYRQMILHDSSFPTAAAAESQAQLLRLEEAYREQEGWLDGNPVREDFRVGTAEAESGPVKSTFDPSVKNDLVTVDYPYTTPEGKVVRAKEQRPRNASGIQPGGRTLIRNADGTITTAAKLLGASVVLPGMAMVPLQAQAAEEAKVRAEQDPSLVNKARAFLEEMSLIADREDARSGGTNVRAGGLSNLSSAASALLAVGDQIATNVKEDGSLLGDFDQEANKYWSDENADQRRQDLRNALLSIPDAVSKIKVEDAWNVLSNTVKQTFFDNSLIERSREARQKQQEQDNSTVERVLYPK